jgi:trk system potassium uptake protein TrkA
MDIAVIGAGEVGYHLAEILSRDEHRVSVIDADPSKARRLMETLDVHVVVGDGSRVDVLTKAGVPKADLVIAVTDHDLVNMLCCTLARKLGARRVILRLQDTSLLEGYRYFYKSAIGFDVVLSTSELAAEEIVNSVRQHNALEVESFAQGRVQLRRFRLPEGSPLVGPALAELDLPSGILIVALARGDVFVVPDGSQVLEKEDQIFVLGESEGLDEFERLTGAPAQGRRSVVILGAGSLGREVTRRLKAVAGISIRVIEREPGRARALAAEHTGDVLVLEGDATDLDLLYEEGIGEANVFVATSDDDELNMVVCQLARSLGVQRTMAVVNKASYRKIYDLLGIDQAISPRVLCANRILRFVRSEAVEAIAVLGEGRAQVLEVIVGNLGRKGTQKLRALGLPKGTVIGALVRDDEVLVPHGDTPVHTGDLAIVFTLPDNVDRALALLRGHEGG